MILSVSLTCKMSWNKYKLQKLLKSAKLVESVDFTIRFYELILRGTSDSK